MVFLLIVFIPGILVNMLICVNLVIVGNRLILKNLRSWSIMWICLFLLLVNILWIWWFRWFWWFGESHNFGKSGDSVFFSGGFSDVSFRRTRWLWRILWLWWIWWLCWSLVILLNVVFLANHCILENLIYILNLVIVVNLFNMVNLVIVHTLAGYSLKYSDSCGYGESGYSHKYGDYGDSGRFDILVKMT